MLTSSESNLKLNAEKSVIILFSSDSARSELMQTLNIAINGHALVFQPSVRRLAVILDHVALPGKRKCFYT